jgi:hypothetical protein
VIVLGSLTRELLIALLTFVVVAGCLLTPKYFSPQGSGTYFIMIVLCAVPLAMIGKVVHKPTKTLLYFFLGFGAYWLVGGLFSLESQASFLPYLLFGIANSLAVLAGLMEDYKYGLIFGSGAFSRVISSMSSPEPYLIDRLDFVLILCVLTPAISMLVSYLTCRIEDMKTMLMATMRAVLITTALNLGVIILEYYPWTNANAMSWLSSTWYYLIASGVFIVVGVSLYFLGLNSLNIIREVTDQGVKYTKVAQYAPAAEEEKDKKDPFSRLISEMESFKKESRSMNKMKAVNMLGRFKKEYDIISRKYEGPNKQKAEKILSETEEVVHNM